MSSTPRLRRGSTVVLASYVTMVAVAAVLGFLLGAAILPSRIEGPLPMAAVGPITFPITPFTLAAYGALMVAVGLGAAIALMAYVSDRYDDAP